MIITPTSIKDLTILEPQIFSDARGYFCETFRQSVVEETISGFKPFVQENESGSNARTIRGLHFQNPPHAQAKLVRVITGKILDFVIDLRKDSSSLGELYSIELSKENRKSLYIPRGFAHGFAVLENQTIIQYKCDNYYHKKSEGGINIFDEKVIDDLPFKREEIILSEKDKSLPAYKNLTLFNTSEWLK